MAERTLGVLPGSAIGITHADGSPVHHANLLNAAQWGNAFSWETPNTLAFTFPAQATPVTFADVDGALTRDPISGSTVTDQRLSEPVTINGTTYTPSSQTTLWQTPPPVFLENVFEVTLVDASGTSYRMAGIGITRGYTTDVVGVTFDGPAPPPGTVLFYRQGNPSFVDRGQSLQITDMVPCFLAGTRIETPEGPRRIENLQVGQAVLTLDHGPRPIRWIGRSRVCGTGPLAPIRFEAGAIGNSRALHLSPNHRVFLRSGWADLHFGCNEVLVAAKFLVNGTTVRRAPRDIADYLHLMFDAHEIVFSEGIASESLLAGPMALRGMDPATQAELRAVFPDLARSSQAASRTCLGRHEARLLLSRQPPRGIGMASMRPVRIGA